MSFIKSFVIFTISYSIGAYVSVFLWMGLFVKLMNYDYVTSSSIFFTLIAIGLIFEALRTISSIRPGARLTYLIIPVIFQPLVFALALRVYEFQFVPEMSNALNVVASYLDIVTFPIVAVASAISSLGSGFTSIVDRIESDVWITQVTASLSVALLMSVMRSFLAKAKEIVEDV